MKRFRPQFGNETHIRIVKEYGQILNLRTLANSEDERREELGKLIREDGARRKRIANKESQLIAALNRELLSPETGVLSPNSST